MAFSATTSSPGSSSAPHGGGGRSLPFALVQTFYLLLGMLAVAAIAGVLMAAFFLPTVIMSSKIAEDGVTLLDSYPAELEVAPLNEASRIEASDGSLLAVFYAENRIMVPLEKISPNIQHAVIAKEDRRFYDHGAVDVRGTARALASNSAGGSTQGGSTLTQQYVKNALLMDAVQSGDKKAIKDATEQTYGRKLKEAKLAISLEKKMSKDEILNAYLNVAQFGPSEYGVETAARHYFNKHAADLNPGEGALLAAITNGPNAYDPVAHPEAGQKRRNEVLTDMYHQEYISKEDYEKYTKQPVKDMLDIQHVKAGCQSAGQSGFFCDYVSRTLLNDPKFAPTFKERKNLLFGGGLTIKTTLDPKKQKDAVDILDRRVPPGSSGFGHSIVTVEPGTGKIESMAQNSTFNPHADAGGGETALNYNVPQAMGGSSGFPVGSTFKVFTLVEWLQSGRTIDDTVPTGRGTMKSFPAKCLDHGRWYETAGYNPDNAVSVPIKPNESALNATKFSINTAYAHMAKQLDLCDIASGARDLGAIPATLNPLNPKTTNLSIAEMYGTELAPAVLVLGELRISALDMASAYATFASGGTYCRPVAINEVTDREGKKMGLTGGQCHQELDKKVADTVAWVLKQDLEDPKATGKGKVIPGHDAGGKTGTSGSQFHTWYVGFTRQMSTAVWFGDPQRNRRPDGSVQVDGEALTKGKVWGNTVSLPTWQEYMTAASKGTPNKSFPDAPAKHAVTEKQPGDTKEGQVPDVSGMVLSEAKRELTTAGYHVEVQQQKSSSVEKWRVIGSAPGPGTELDKGKTVTIRQSSGS